MSARDIKHWDLIWAGTRIVALWFDPVTGKRIEAPVFINPEGDLKVQMPSIDLEDIR